MKNTFLLLKLLNQLKKNIILFLLIMHLFYSIIYNKKPNSNESNIYKYINPSKSLNNQNYDKIQNKYSVIKNNTANFFFYIKKKN